MAIHKYVQVGSLFSFIWFVSALPSLANTYTVNTTQDPGPAGTLSLRQAIAEASIADTITFDSSLSGKTCKVKSTLSVLLECDQPGLKAKPNNFILAHEFVVDSQAKRPFSACASKLEKAGNN